MKARYYGYRILDHDKQAEGWRPQNPKDFEFSVDFYAGSESGADAFTAVVWSPARFLEKYAATITSAQGVLIMPSFDHSELDAYLRNLCENTEAKTWDALALKLNGAGRWEFAYRT